MSAGAILFVGMIGAYLFLWNRQREETVRGNAEKKRLYEERKKHPRRPRRAVPEDPVTQGRKPRRHIKPKVSSPVAPAPEVKVSAKAKEQQYDLFTDRLEEPLHEPW